MDSALFLLYQLLLKHQLWFINVTLVANPIKENDESTPNVIDVVFVMGSLFLKISPRTDAGIFSSYYTYFKNIERGTNHEYKIL